MSAALVLTVTHIWLRETGLAARSRPEGGTWYPVPKPWRLVVAGAFRVEPIFPEENGLDGKLPLSRVTLPDSAHAFGIMATVDDVANAADARVVEGRAS